MTAAPRDPTARFLAPRQSRGSAPVVVVLVRRPRPTRPSSNDVDRARPSLRARTRVRLSPPGNVRPFVRPPPSRARESRIRAGIFSRTPFRGAFIGVTSRPRGGRGVGRRGGDSIDRSIDRSVATRRSVGDSMDRVHGDGSRLVNFKKKERRDDRDDRGARSRPRRVEDARWMDRSIDRWTRRLRSIDRSTRIDGSIDRSIDSMDDASRIARARCVLIDCRCDARGSRRRGACDRCRRPSREAMRGEARRWVVVVVDSPRSMDSRIRRRRRARATSERERTNVERTASD